MAEPLKNLYDKKFVAEFTTLAKSIVKGFDEKKFTKAIFDKQWPSRELKERMRHLSTKLQDHLPGTHKQQVKTIVKFSQQLIKDNKQDQGLQYMFLPDFIEVYGTEDYESAIKAFEKITVFTSCEFAVRPFLLQYQDKMMAQFLSWSKHKNLHVRRFASEGCRPRLPWAMGIPALKKDPKQILPILENLKNDPSEYVRRSVANNLNDISKDHPNIVIKIAKRWMGNSIETDKLVKHACRTLLKQGNEEVMSLFGFGALKHTKIRQLKILTPKVKIGGAMEFSFNLVNTDKAAVKVRLEYAVYYQKANGTLTKKVYNISESDYPAKSTTTFQKKRSFQIITTRKFHKGLHQLAIIVNGREGQKVDFMLV